MTSENDVLESIDKLYDQLFSKERQIADYIRANPQEVIMMNVSQLAKASKTSEATVVRTCKHLGYQGYYQMRLVLSRDIGTKSNDADLNEEGDFVQRIFEHNIQNLRAIASRLSKKELLTCAYKLTHATAVHILAIGNTTPIALDLSFRLSRFGVQAFSSSISEYYLNNVSLGKETDVVIALSGSGTAKQVLQAVDIAKETADVILLDKDLNVLLDGVLEGRRTFANLMKYIKLAVSFNFGEVLSVIIASVALPFLPETPIQLLVEGLLYDIGQLTLPFDHVDEEYLQKPRKFDMKGLKHFMLFMGPFSSCFDLIVFASLWFFLGIREASVFQTVWFVYSIVSNLIGMHMIRTAKIPFVQSHAHKMVYFSSILLCIIGIIVPFTFFGRMIGLVAIPLSYLGIIFGVTFLYCVLSLFAKKIYIKKYGEWI